MVRRRAKAAGITTALADAIPHGTAGRQQSVLESATAPGQRGEPVIISQRVNCAYGGYERARIST